MLQTIRINHPTGAAASAALLLAWLALELGVELPPGVADSLIVLALGAVSLLTPRLQGYSYGAATASAGVLVLLWIARLAGVDLPEQVAVAAVSLAAIVVSAIRPRFEPLTELADNVPANGHTGPDPADL